MVRSLESNVEPSRELVSTHVQRIATDVAARWAADVDQSARFPVETFAALKDVGCLSAGIPSALGGGGHGIADLAEMCAKLAQHCASSGMILAMHFAQVGCLVHGAGSVPQMRQYLGSLAREQRLIASATSEVGTDGDLRRSIAGLTHEPGDRYSLIKEATTVSYGEHADDLLITVRNAPDATEHDQRLVLTLRGGFSLETTSAWDTLGMRGTCSPGGRVSATVEPWQILPIPFARIAERYMVPYSHILWASVWLGIAASAAAIARRTVQRKARKDPHTSPSGASRLGELDCKLQLMRSDLLSVLRDYEHYLAAETDKSAQVPEVGLTLRVNNLKLNASRLVREVVTDAMEICGISGYRNDSESSLSRHLRDGSSAALMVSNERILRANAMMHLVYKGGMEWVDLCQ